MNKNTTISFLLALAIMLGGAGVLFFLKAHKKLGNPGVKTGPVPLFNENGKPISTQSVLLPERVEGFRSRLLPISLNDLRYLPADTTYGRRAYETQDGFKLTANVVLMGGDRTSIHKPEYCLPGQGWSIEKRELIHIMVSRPTHYQLPAMKWTVRQLFQNPKGETLDVRGVYVFWFVSDTEITPFHSGRVWSIAKHLLSKGELERWAYVSFFSACSPGQEQSTFGRLEQLIKASVPEFQLTTGASEEISNTKTVEVSNEKY
jgi:hypothetical protein